MADTVNTSAPVEETAAAAAATTGGATNGAAEAETAAAPTETAAAASKEEDPAEAKEETRGNGAAKRKASDKDDEKDSKRPRKDNHAPRGRRDDYNKNVKTDYSKLEESSDPEEIRKQVEFYFSDSNLPMDTYLYNLVGGSENKSVPVKVIHSFKRMKRFQPYSAVVAALQSSEVLEIAGDAGKEEIKRKVPIGTGSQEESYKAFEDKTMPRSIYAKGFGQEGPTTQFDLEEFFAPYGPINSVRMRRSFPEKVFKGSVFVEFDSEDTQKEFLALDPKPKYNGKDLLIMSKKAYTDMKSEDIRQGKIKPNNERPGYEDRYSNRGRKDHRGGKRDGGRGRNGRDNDRDDWKGRRDNFQKGRRGGKYEDDGVRRCYQCNEPGHRKNDCPQTKPSNGDGAKSGRDKPAEKAETKEVLTEA